MDKLKSFFGALLFSLGCANISASPSPETISPNTIEKTIEYEEQGISSIPKIPISRGDFSVNIFLDRYNVGDILTYSGKIQNTQDSKITINNNKGLVWKLLREGKVFHTQKFEKDFSVIFKKKGFIEFDYVDNFVKLETSSTIIEYNGETYNIRYPVRGSLSIDDILLYELTEPGNYVLQLCYVYEIENKKFETIFESKEFEVSEK